MQRNEIKNIVFDLGGVLLDIDPQLSYRAFSELIQPQFSLDNWGELLPIVHLMEIGAISNNDFYDRVKALVIAGTSLQEIKDAWCSMLIGVPECRIEMLKQLAQKYRLFVLSNTNSLHIEQFEEMFEQIYGFGLKSMFEQVYYSSEIGERKPHQAAFQHVLNQSGLNSFETIMVDDLPDNCAAAKSIGMHAIQVPINTGLEAVIHLLT